MVDRNAEDTREVWTRDGVIFVPVSVEVLWLHDWREHDSLNVRIAGERVYRGLTYGIDCAILD